MLIPAASRCPTLYRTTPRFDKSDYCLARESLVPICLGSQSANGLTQGCLFPTTVVLAERWGVLPRLRDRAALLFPTAPQEVVDDIRGRFIEGYVRSTLQARDAIDVLGAFEREGIPAAAFKGLASMGVLYGKPEGRVMLDADILVSEMDLPRAASLLGDLGFRPEVPGRLVDYIDFVRRAPGFGGNEVLTFHNQRGSTIDLHWRLGRGFDTGALLARRQTVQLLGSSFPAVSSADGFLLTVHHSLRNDFSPDHILRDLLDLEHWCAHLAGSGRIQPALEEAFARKLAVPLLALTSILTTYNPQGQAAGVRDRLETAATIRQRQFAWRLVSLFATQMTEGPLDRDLLYLFRASELKLILAGVLFGGRRHLEMARSMDSALSGQPATFRQRAAVLIRGLRRVRPRHIGMLRALARTKDDFARAA